jgi:hypothetical protein
LPDGILKNLGIFWRALEWKMFVYFMANWNILKQFGIFLPIWYISPRFGLLYQEKSGNPV